MRVSAWRGAVVLEDVELRKDCLDHFFPINTAATDANGGCPLEICHGRVGRLELRIPWKLLRSQLFVSSSSSSAASSSSTTSNSSSATKSKNAVDATTTTTTSAAAPVDPSLAICVVINNVNILVTPRKTKKKHPSEPCDIPNNNNNNNTDDHNHNTSKRLEDLSVAEQDAIRESSAQQAMDAELLGRIARSARPLHQQSPPIDEEEEVGATTKNNDATLAVTWKTKLQERAKALLSNLSVTIQNIHIRYEDPGTSMGFRWQTCSNNSPEDSSGFGLDDSFVTCTTSQQYILQRQSLADQIRYRPSFAIGVTLSEFTIQNAPPAAEVPVSFTSTNVPSSPTLTPVHDTKERSALQYKIASAQQLAIYWDSNAHIMSANNVRGGNNEETVDGFSTLQTFNFEAEFELINRVNEPTISIPTSEYSIRMFLLEPSSPSIRLGLSSSEKTSPPCTNTVDVSLLPCRFFVSRNLMEDLSYLRTCFAIWKQSQNGLLLSEETLQHLAHLRPKQESSSPRGWWKYAFAAVSAVVKSHCNHQPNAPPSSKEIPLRRYKGWVGLSQALGRRRFYSSLYRTFLVCDDQYGREMAHDDLLLYERTLLVDEIVSFRIETVKDIRDDVKNGRPAPSTKTWETLLLTMSSARNENDVDDSDVVSALNVPLPQDVLSAEHRSQMFVEIAMALNREQRNLDLQISILGNRCIPPRDTIAMVTMKVTKLATWKALFQCSELSFQVNDSVELPRDGIRELGSIRGTALTVVKLSCAVKYEQELFDDGSWDMTSRVGSLLVEDSTVHNCKTLIGLKRGFQSDPTDEDTFLLCGSTYHQNIWVRIQRTMWKTADCPGSTTSTMVRVLPLEVIYTTAPFELLNHVFNVANLDFADDYNHIANRLATWRRRQQNRLISALAHKQKKILVDVIVGAPVLVFQDDRDPDLRFLSIDLGKLEFANNNNGFEGCDMDVDDKWRLQLTDVQIQSTARQNVNSIEDVSSQWAEKIIEPFSLTIELAAKFLSESNMVSEEETVVRCSISLPRLALNLTSSIFHLGRRLKTKWEVQSNRRRPVSLFPRQSATTTSSHAGGLSSAKKLRTDSARRLELHFSAPFFGLTFENDQVGHLDGSLSSPSTKPLIELALQGIEGRLIQERQPEGTSTDFTAKIRALGVVDLYQTAGDKFAFLISSVSPDLLNRGTTVSMKSFDSHLSVTDLVLFEYSAWGSSSEPSNSRFEQSGNRGDKLYIKFNELYIEWNPETLSAVCAVLYLSDDDYVDFSDGLVGSEKPIPRSGRCQGQGAGDHEDEFYDAVEEAFFDAESDVYMGNRSPLLSEVSESDQSAAAEIESVDLSPKFSWTTQQSSPPRAFLPSAVLGSPWTMQVRRPITAPPLPSTPLRVRPFEIVFMLSKLRVNFNRESRHRRLLTAEMDGTVVRRANLKEGGWRTLFTIGNLTFADCESSNNRTLYREILGLKTDAGPTATIFSSLLEMELITKPRSRCYVSLATDLDDPSLASDLPVSVDNEAGAVHGFDNYLRARFSPMRFVYLQQLWFEIIDYFFIGIVGYEVWGGKTPPPGDLSILEGHSICADEISFTRFDVRMDVPLLLFPVSSCSTDFVRVEADSISFSNQYSYAPLRSPSLQFRDGGNRQWYNKCKVEICSVSLSSWAGNTMNKANNRPSVSLSLAWPVGPSAPVNVPKWKAECVVGDLHLQLNRQHYALLQHIIQFNICEESHHLEEWYALQSLTQENRQSFLNGIRVHFGYDKKDATPSTFVVDLVVPTITFTIQCDDGQDIAVVRCSDVRWNYEKLADRVSKQLVNCDFEIISSMLDSVILTTNKTRTVSLPRLSYSTTTKPSGDNTKSLCVDDSCIFFVFPAWVLISSFFQNLPQPKYLSPSEAIQVGDRWYRIGEQNVLNREKDDVLLKWLVYDSLNQPETFVSKSQVKYEFRLSLKRPTIDFGGSESAIVLSADHIQFLHIGQADLLQRSFQISDMEVQTRRAGQGAMSSDCSLIRPWTVSVSMESCNGRQTCSCESHVYRLFADTLYARASFSDIAIVLDTALSQFRDAKNAEKPIHEKPKPQSSNEKFDSSDSMCQSTTTQNLNFEWKGFRLVVADNSGRQFAGDQELFIAHLGPVDLFRESRYFSNNDALDHMTPASASVEYSTRLKLSGLDFFDCLQAINSPFRHVIAVHPTPRYHQNAESFPVQPDGKEGGLKPAIVLWNTVAATNAYGVEVSSMEIQYNPSFVVAIQRFLGRLFKEVRQLHPDLGFVKTNRPLNTNVAKSDTKISSIAVLRADIDVRHISIRLNKEHQKRRLLEASIASVHVGCEWTALGCLIRGHIGSVHAVNPEAKRDGYIEDVLKNACDVEKVVNFRYRSFTKRKIEHQHSTEAVPDWISQELGSSDVIDDFLEVNIATLEAVYLRERTAELIDYLTNGMPGKGMGVTSRAAQEFVTDRIQKKSFFNVKVDAPRLLIPQNPVALSGLSVRLGT